MLIFASIAIALSIGWLNGKRERRNPSLKQITVGDLIRAAECGRLELSA